MINAQEPAAGASATIDPEEVARFSAWADEWWDPKGKFRPLHKFNPARLEIILERISTAFDRDLHEHLPLEGLRILDIGCGGGLIAEPLARLGAQVMGVDAAERNIEAAKIHAESQGLDIDYRAVDAESLIAAGETFDLVLALEVVEHVADRALFVQLCTDLVAPSGYLLLSTINRTRKAYALAIFGVEQVLRWLPKGTHHYDKLVKPTELESDLQGFGFTPEAPIGLVFNPLMNRWSRSGDTDINYFLGARRS